MKFLIKYIIIVLLTFSPLFCWAQGKIYRNTTTKEIPTKRGKITNGTENGYEWVDLGLPSGTKWAKCNIGAFSPEEFGDYYGWGEVSVRDLTMDNSITMKKDISDISGNKKYDVASLLWGGGWCIPSQQNMTELLTECKVEIIFSKGCRGIKFTGINGNSIFLPLAGMKLGLSYHWEPSKYGAYWTSTPDYTDNRIAYKLNYSPYTNKPEICGTGRYFPCSIRPILKQ